MVAPGTYVINNTTANIAPTRGQIHFRIRSIGTPETADATKRFGPYGGVTNPTAKLAVITTPKVIGSTPHFITTGSKIGDRIMVAGILSIMHPKASKIG